MRDWSLLHLRQDCYQGLRVCHRVFDGGKGAVFGVLMGDHGIQGFEGRRRKSILGPGRIGPDGIGRLAGGVDSLLGGCFGCDFGESGIRLDGYRILYLEVFGIVFRQALMDRRDPAVVLVVGK